jgi:tetratricopeptide (TPR) repeat protein
MKALMALILLGAAGCAQAPSSAAERAAVMRQGQTRDELVARGSAFASIGDLTRAEQYLSASLRQGAEVRAVLPLLVHVCIQAGRYRVAADYLRAYGGEDADNVELHMLSGLLEAAVGDRDVARSEYETVLRADPEDAGAHWALAVLLRDTSDAPEANVHFREYLRLAPSGQHAAEARASIGGEAP